MGTLICGSSSRGSDSRAMAPTASEASSSSGVRGERMKVRVSTPERPSLMAFPLTSPPGGR
ncbi:hypothetical protein D3C71_2027830 [compost metagenome]